MARYRIDCDKTKMRYVGGQRAFDIIDSTSLHINASNKEAAMEKFNKQFTIDETDGFVYTFYIQTDNKKGK